MNNKESGQNKVAGGAFAGFVGFLAFIKEFASVILMSLIIVIPVRYFLVQPFIVKGESMEPNFHGGDYLIVNEIGFRLKGVERGEVIIFENPNNDGEYYIKRVVGLPGEKIEIKGGSIKIYNQEYPNGFTLDESRYLPSGIITRGNKFDEVSLGEEEYFVLGDNRNHSLDSRIIGALNEERIVGKTWVRAWPFDQFEVYSFKKE